MDETKFPATEPSDVYTTSHIIADLDTRLGTPGAWTSFHLAHVEGVQVTDIVFSFDPGALNVVLDFQLVLPTRTNGEESILARGTLKDIIAQRPIVVPLRTGIIGYLDPLVLKMRITQGSPVALDQALVSLRIKRRRDAEQPTEATS